MSFINVNDELERRESQIPWQTAGKFRFKAFLEKDNLFAAAAVRRLSRENTSGMSIISKAATAQWLINAKLALELNDRGIHARIGSACTCGLRLEVERLRGKKPVSWSEFEELLFSLPGHLDTNTISPASQDIVRGFIEWPEHQYWIQPAGRLIETRWHCVICGDFAPAQMSADGADFWISHIFTAEHDEVVRSGVVPTIWTESQLAQLSKWRDQAAAKAAKAAKTKTVTEEN
jgi:uncharacterized protein YggL (DUF469 family)